MSQKEVTVKMYLGLVEETEEYDFSYINGMTPKLKTHMPPLSALGRILPQDIGLRIYGRQVESLDNMLARKGVTLERHRLNCNVIIKHAKSIYAGQKNRFGDVIVPEKELYL